MPFQAPSNVVFDALALAMIDLGRLQSTMCHFCVTVAAINKTLASHPQVSSNRQPSLARCMFLRVHSLWTAARGFCLSIHNDPTSWYCRLLVLTESCSLHARSLTNTTI